MEATIEDLPEEILLIIFKYVYGDRKCLRPKLIKLVQVNRNWKRIVEQNFTYYVTNFFNEPRSLADYETMINSNRKLDDIWVKPFLSDHLQHNALKKFLEFHPVKKATLDYSNRQDYLIRPHEIFSYISLVKHVERLDIVLNLAMDPVEYSGNLVIKLENLKTLRVIYGRYNNLLKHLIAPKIETMDVLMPCTRKGVPDFMDFVIRHNTLTNINFDNSFEWSPKRMTILTVQNCKNTMKVFLKNHCRKLINIEMHNTNANLNNLVARKAGHLKKAKVQLQFITSLRDNVVFPKVIYLTVCEFVLTNDNVLKLKRHFPNIEQLELWLLEHSVPEEEEFVRAVFRNRASLQISCNSPTIRYQQ